MEKKIQTTIMGLCEMQSKLLKGGLYGGLYRGLL